MPVTVARRLAGALVTMPHKIATVALLDEVSVAVQVAGSCNAILKRPDGTLLGTLDTGRPTGNVCWGDDGTTLYIAADTFLVRIKTTTNGKDF